MVSGVTTLRLANLPESYSLAYIGYGPDSAWLKSILNIKHDTTYLTDNPLNFKYICTISFSVYSSADDIFP